jgi:cell shape-determining protein MreC
VVRLHLRADVSLLLACLALYVASAAQIRTIHGSALTSGLFVLWSPVPKLAASLAEVWDDWVVGRHDLEATLEEHATLRREVARLREANQVLASDLLALRQGSALLAGFPTLIDRSTVARVITRDVLVSHTMRLDRGRSDGIRVDSPVLGEHGVIGRVDQLADRSCRVQLLSHPSAAAAARVVDLQGEGLLLGGDRPIITGLPPYLEVPAGALVLTTGSEGIYPPGLLLGETGEAKTEGLFTVVPVRLAARPTEALVVLVLAPEGAEAR